MPAFEVVSIRVFDFSHRSKKTLSLKFLPIYVISTSIFAVPEKQRPPTLWELVLKFWGDKKTYFFEYLIKFIVFCNENKKKNGGSFWNILREQEHMYVSA